MSDTKQVYFDDFIIGRIYCVQYSGVRTYYRVVTKSENEISVQIAMRDGTPHPHKPRPDVYSREQWRELRWDLPT